jgi:hypothetical protein
MSYDLAAACPVYAGSIRFVFRPVPEERGTTIDEFLKYLQDNL